MNKILTKNLIDKINTIANSEIRIMEICGTHTQMISQFGLRSILSPNIKLLSGPGCPVCVTDESYIDAAIQISEESNVIIATFGDLMRVNGSKGNLLDEKSKGKDIRVICSPLDLLDLAQKNKEKKIIFLGVGFETTAPIIALSMKNTILKGINNLFFLISLKLMNPIINYVLKQPNFNIHGLICPGHVASVVGSKYFEFIKDTYNTSAVICGFEALDIVKGVFLLVKQNNDNEKKVFSNLYNRCVTSKGNISAQKIINEVFEVSDGIWRGIGSIKESSLVINSDYKHLDALKEFGIKIHQSNIKSKCQCTDILLGLKVPRDCIYFKKICNPLNPIGPCMISSEGSCSIAYKYQEGI